MIGQLFQNKKILIVGDIMLDQYVEGTIERMSPEAPVPILEVRQIYNQPGGAANVAANVVSLGGTAYLMGHVGDDVPGQIIKNLLALSHIVLLPLSVDNRQTSVKTRLVSGHQQMIRFDQETRTPIKGIEKQMSVALRRMTVNGIILSDYDKGVLTPGSIAFFRELHCDIPIVVDPKYRNFWEYHGLTAIMPNLQEALVATEANEPLEACRQIMRMLLPRHLLLKRGDKGMLLIEGDEITEIPAHRIEVADVTGAGDTVIAVYTLGLASGMIALEAAKLANLAAAISVQHHRCYPVKMQELKNAWTSFDDTSDTIGCREP